MKVPNYGLKNEFLDGYNAFEVLTEYGIDSEMMVNRIIDLL